MLVKELLKKCVYWIFRTFCPIDNYKILFESYYGAQYGCNPKYLSEYIVKNASQLKVTWAFVGNYPTVGNVKTVKYNSLRYFYELATAHFFVTNYRTVASFKKRRGQLYFQTWHSSLRLKMIEKDAEKSLNPEYIEMAKADSKRIDYLISGCKASTAIFKQAFWYDGTILEVGTPRIDFLLQPLDKAKIVQVRGALGIPIGAKIVMYAPTFRKNYSMECYEIDFERLLKSLEAKYENTNWVVVVRLHPHLRNYSSQLTDSNPFLIDATTYPDIQELLFVSDVLITDYSSLMFDYLFMKRPCFIFARDLDSYTQNDRGLYFKISELPFSVSTDDEELCRQVAAFDREKAIARYEAFIENVGSFEDGRASEKITNIILNSL